MTQIKKVCQNQKLALESTPIKNTAGKNMIGDGTSYPVSITKNIEGNALCSYHSRLQTRRIKQLRKTHRLIIIERKDHHKSLLPKKNPIKKQTIIKNAFNEEAI